MSESNPKPQSKRSANTTRFKSIRKAERFKQFFKVFINVNYIAGFLYAFYFFITTPRGTQLFQRRLWAYECWLILTGYGVFIYLFYLEKSALEGQRGLFRFMRIQANTFIKASKDQLLVWFDKIASRPELYQFDSHAGVRVEQGSLIKPGSLFTTREQFLGIELKLKFEVTAVKENKLEFKLLNPRLKWLGIRGRFDYQQLDQNLIKLSLTIFNHPQTAVKRFLSAAFYLSPVRILVAQQIKKEVEFIAQEVEQL